MSKNDIHFLLKKILKYKNPNNIGKDASLIKEIDNQSEIDQMFLVEKCPNVIPFFSNPSVELQKNIAKNKKYSFFKMQNIDHKALMFYFKHNKDEYNEEIISKILAQYSKNKVINYNELKEIHTIITKLTMAFYHRLNLSMLLKHIDKIDDISQIKLVKENIWYFQVINNPCAGACLEYVLQDPDHLCAISSILTDEMYEIFFAKYKTGLELSPENYSEYINFPRHIIQKYIKHFDKDCLNDYAQVMLHKKTKASPEFLQFLYENIDNVKIKKQIKKHPNYLDISSLVLKNIEDQINEENKLFMKSLDVESIDSIQAKNILKDIVASYNEGFDSKKILTIISGLKKDLK